MPVGAATTVIHPSADAFVSSANPDMKTGTRQNIRYDSSAKNTRVGYVQYVVPMVTGSVQSASIHPYITDKGTFEVHATTAFNEKTITAKNAPKVGALIATVDANAKGSTMIDVTKAFTAGRNPSSMTVAFAIVAKGSAGAFASHENKLNKPADLVLGLTGTSTDTTSASPATTSTTKAANPITTTTTKVNNTTTTQGTTNTSLPPISSTQPTLENTGPRVALTGSITPEQFYASRVCNRQRVTGAIMIKQQSMRGQTFSFTDCVVEGTIEIDLQRGGLPLATKDFPTVNFNYSRLTGGFYFSNMGVLNMDHSSTQDKSKFSAIVGDDWYNGPGPLTITNSFMYAPYQTYPMHYSPIQVIQYIDGARFINVTFLQGSGPVENSGITSAFLFGGTNSIMDHCYFLWTSNAPTWYTAYITGKGNVVKNSYFMKGANDYVYPGPSNGTEYFPATYQNNFDYQTGKPISLP